MINFSEKRGVISVIALLMLGIMLLLGAYFLSFTLTERKISKSQEVASQTYYLAETGINEAIWKLKNDPVWSICFVTSTATCAPATCNNWSSTTAINTNNLIPNSTVTVSILNSGCGNGEIIATSTVSLPGGKIAQRVVKTSVYKALSPPTQDAAIMTGGASMNVTVHDSNLKVYGNFYVGNGLDIDNSNIDIEDSTSNDPIVDGKILVVGNYNESGPSPSTTAICAFNICNTTTTCDCIADADNFQECTAGQCHPVEVSAPAVDFYTDPNYSFYYRASTSQNALPSQCEILCNGSPCTAANCGGSYCGDKCIITSGQFSSILAAVGTDGTVTLNNEITYITGSGFTLNCKTLIVNGTLVANGAVNIGTSQCGSAKAQITINRLNATSTSGLLVNGGDTFFGQYSFRVPTILTGVIYAYGKKLEFNNLPEQVTIVGGIIGRKVDIQDVANLFTLELDNEVLLYSLGYKINTVAINPIFSPIITTDHWEESY